MPTTQANAPLRRLAPSSSRPDSLAPSHRASFGHFRRIRRSSPVMARKRVDQGDARDEAELARRGRRRRVDQQQACIEIAGRRDPDAAHAPPAPRLRRGDDPQPAGIARRDPAHRLVIGRAERGEDFEAIAGPRGRRPEGAIKIHQDAAVTASPARRAIDRDGARRRHMRIMPIPIRTASGRRRWPPRPAAPDRPRTAAWRARPGSARRAG